MNYVNQVKENLNNNNVLDLKEQNALKNLITSKNKQEVSAEILKSRITLEATKNGETTQKKCEFPVKSLIKAIDRHFPPSGGKDYKNINNKEFVIGGYTIKTWQLWRGSENIAYLQMALGVNPDGKRWNATAGAARTVVWWETKEATTPNKSNTTKNTLDDILITDPLIKRLKDNMSAVNIKTTTVFKNPTEEQKNVYARAIHNKNIVNDLLNTNNTFLSVDKEKKELVIKGKYNTATNIPLSKIVDKDMSILDNNTYATTILDALSDLQKQEDAHENRLTQITEITDLNKVLTKLKTIDDNYNTIVTSKYSLYKKFSEIETILQKLDNVEEEMSKVWDTQTKNRQTGISKIIEEKKDTYKVKMNEYKRLYVKQLFDQEKDGNPTTNIWKIEFTKEQGNLQSQKDSLIRIQKQLEEHNTAWAYDKPSYDAMSQTLNDAITQTDNKLKYSEAIEKDKERFEELGNRKITWATQKKFNEDVVTFKQHMNTQKSIYEAVGNSGKIVYAHFMKKINDTF